MTTDMKTLLAIFPGLLAGSVVATASAVDPQNYVVTAEPSAIMVNFASGADTRGFAWQTDASVTNGELRLVRGTVASDADFERAALVFPAVSKRVKDPDLVRHRAFAIGLRLGAEDYIRNVNGG